jgi:RNA polymerase sigma-70 factor (ECF subfamily)
MNEAMHDHTARLAGSLVTVDRELEREFETRLTESSTLAFRVAYAVLRHREDAEDVAQEAFVRAHRSFRDLRERDRFRAWLVRMTWRMALDRQRTDRRRAGRDRHPDAMRTAASSPVAEGFRPAAHEALEAQERARRLWAAIDALPEKLRLAIVLANIEEHDLGEVGRLLDVPEGTVKSRLFLARQRLKELLQ